MPYKYVYKKDFKVFVKKLEEFLEKVCRKKGPYAGYDYWIVYYLDTNYGELLVHAPSHDLGDGVKTRVLSLFTQFSEVDKLPPEANQHSGKWNFNTFCLKDEGAEKAEDIIEDIQTILLKEKTND